VEKSMTYFFHSLAKMVRKWRLARYFDILTTTLTTILKNEVKIIADYEAGRSSEIVAIVNKQHFNPCQALELN